jgi:hypothetical protein
MKKRRRILWVRLITWLATMVSSIAFLYVYFGTGVFTIRTYEIEGAPPQYVEELRNGFDILAEQKLFYSLPGNRIISFHDEDIRTLIQETLTNTKDITIYPKGLHTLYIKIESYVPLFAVSDTHAITEDSVVYKEIIPLTEYPRLEVASTTVVTKERFNSLAKLVKNLSAVIFPIRYIVIDQYDDVRLYDERHRSAVILALSSDTGKVWSNLLSAIDTEPLKTKLAAEGSKLDYLDTRFGNKVFYKFTNGDAPAIIPSENATSTATTTLQ